MIFFFHVIIKCNKLIKIVSYLAIICQDNYKIPEFIIDKFYEIVIKRCKWFWSSEQFEQTSNNVNNWQNGSIRLFLYS